MESDPAIHNNSKSARRGSRRFFGFLFITAACAASWVPAFAQDQTLSSPPSSLWQAGVGEGFEKGSEELGLALGAGLGMKVFGSRNAHDWGLGAVQYGIMLGGLTAQNHWYRGNWEFVAQLFGGEQFHPDAAYLVGVTPMLRYNFAAGHRWVPFFDAGPGITLTDIRNGDLSTTPEFNLQVGLGTRCFLRDNLALTLQYRLIHLSNAGAASPNLGVNTSNVLLGLAWFF